MQYIGETNDNVLTLKDEDLDYECIFVRSGFKTKKHVFKNQNLLASIDLSIKFLPFKVWYTIDFVDSNQTYTLQYKKILKPYYIFSHEGDLYEIYPHRGTKTSIFKNNRQVAYYENTFINRFNKSLVKIYCDKGINLDVIFILISSINFDFEDDSHTGTINFGNIFQVKKFDKNWTPN